MHPYPYEDLIRIRHAELRRAADHHRLVSTARAADPWPQPIGQLRELLRRISAWARDLERGPRRVRPEALDLQSPTH